MGSLAAVSTAQFGLLDLAVEFSVSEVYAGKDFTLCLHVKNPFPTRIWIRSVELGLPTQLIWRPLAVKQPPTGEAERVPLTGSLSKGAALEPGCTDVWTVRLGSRRDPFHIPAQYRLQLTVIYSLEPPVQPTVKNSDKVSLGEQLFSNTTTVTVPVKAPLWSVILAGTIGGFVGSIGRSLQEAGRIDVLLGEHLEGTVGALFLALVLSGAGIIFAARKSNTQALVTVEDFWGGLLAGFLIGYSGTAAFSNMPNAVPLGPR